MSKLKLLIIGKGRMGKDTVAEILRDDLGFTFKSSSYAAYEIFIYKIFKEKYAFSTLQEAYEARHDYREELFQLIQEYNTPDKTKLAKSILEMSDMYVGMRCKQEVEACITKGIFDLIIWVDASERVDYVESEDSITVTKAHADIIIDNNGTEEELRKKVYNLGRILYNSHNCVTLVEDAE